MKGTATRVGRSPHLSKNWTVAQVEQALDADDKQKLILFLRERHGERFFEPIHVLLEQSERRRHESGADRDWRFGFSIMALSCLLVETFQSYREGSPSTNRKERKDCAKMTGLAAECTQPTSMSPNGKEAFKRFFEADRAAFPDVDGEEFYASIRCGLLHQAQTKNGWKIFNCGKMWDEADKTVNRTRFARALEDAFRQYLRELETDAELWRAARRKMRWLCVLSR